MKIDLFSAGTCRALGWFMNRSAPFKSVTVPVGVALIHHPTAGLILFDTGLHPRCLTISHWSQVVAHQLIHFNTTSADTVVSWLDRKGIESSDIRYIILSHYHNDHMGGLLDFPTAQFVGSRIEYRRLKKMSPFQQSSAAFNAALLPADFEQRLIAVEDLPAVQRPELAPFGEVKEAFPDVFLVNLPGHTRVQFGAYLPAESTFLIADALWTGVALDGLDKEPPSIVRLIKDSWQNYRQTIQQLREFRALHPEVRILASHDNQAFTLPERG